MAAPAFKGAPGRIYYQELSNPHHFLQLLLIQHTPFEDEIGPIKMRGGAVGMVLTLDSERSSCRLEPQLLAVRLITGLLAALHEMEKLTRQTR